MRPGVVACVFALMALFTGFSAHRARKQAVQYGERQRPEHWPRGLWTNAQVADAPRTVPLIYWTEGIETAESLKRAGIEQIAAPADKAETWRRAGFKVVAVGRTEFERREKLLTPRITGRADVASATRRPWVDANGWRFVRNPAGKFYYELPQGKAAMAIAEAFTYKADAILKIDQADLTDAGAMFAFIKNLSGENYPPIADLGVMDDKSPETGEVMNLLTRRNLLFKIVETPEPQFRVNIKLGSKEYPKAEAANPSEFAQKIRQRLGDDNRSLRVYGTETVICRLTGEGARARLHLLNYSGRDVDGLRLRLRGNYGRVDARAFGLGRIEPEDLVNDETATEFSVSGVGIYTVIDLSR
ncbi:MAG TPA: hypothetical protein VFV58_32955 [Blastocatellia bacterium]|jgi:hypothetical protein|nr:hypothetical protein [Blastocatellia bacterium]